MWYHNEKADLQAKLDPYFANLSNRAQNQIRDAFDVETSTFLTRYVWGRLFNPVGGMGQQDSWYVCLSQTPDLPGRNHRLTEALWREGHQQFPNNAVGVAFFTNHMQQGTYEVVGGSEVWSQPSQRVYGGFWQAFTIEFDVNDLEFFETQLAWCRGGMKSKIADLYAHFSQYVDFEGNEECGPNVRRSTVHPVDRLPISDGSGDLISVAPRKMNDAQGARRIVALSTKETQRV